LVFRNRRQGDVEVEDLNVNTTAEMETVMITGQESSLPKDLLDAMARSAAKVGVRGGPALGEISDDHDRSTTSLIGKEPTEELEAWKNKGLAAVKSVSWNSAASNTLQDITPRNFESKMKELLKSAETRFIFSPGNAKAREFMVTQLKQALGDENTVKTQDFGVSFGGLRSYHGKGVNVIGTLKGTENPEEYVVLGAHYDSIPNSGPAPGADDNGSGATALLLAAKALKEGLPHKRTILFVSFSGEEEGLLGSTAFVQSRIAEDPTHFKGAIILDQVGFTRNHKSPGSVIFETSGSEGAKQRIIDTMALTAENVLPGTHFDVNYHGWGSDHMPFLEAGSPAVLLIERDNLYSADHYGHTPKDAIGNLDFNFAAKVARLAAASISNLSSPDEAKKKL